MLLTGSPHGSAAPAASAVTQTTNPRQLTFTTFGQPLALSTPAEATSCLEKSEGKGPLDPQALVTAAATMSERMEQTPW